MAKGYNKPKSPKMGGGGGGMMQHLQQMQEQMETIQAKLSEETVTASVGGGVVKITMTGDQVCKQVQIDPELLNDGDSELLQDMLLSAINMGLEKSRELQSQRMGSITGGLSGIIPGL